MVSFMKGKIMRIERLLSTNDGEVVVLYVDSPKASERESEYYCKIGLEGGSISETATIYGEFRGHNTK